jgi:hypothetical protein
MSLHPRQRNILASPAAIWVFAFGYFFFYVPFSGLTKALSGGVWPGQAAPVSGVALLPIASVASVVVMAVFLVATGWWRAAHRVQVGHFLVPVPTRWTALSGACTSMILGTTTLAYTFDGVSIVFMMLLMRGGVLILAPIVDTFSGRKQHWYSWVGLLLSLAALTVAFAGRSSYEMRILAGVDLALYLLSYFVRFAFMSRLAKSPDPEVNKRYFVEEQLMVAPLTLLVLALLALWGHGTFMSQLRYGFTDYLDSGLVVETALLGACSQMVGICGTLVFLDKRENTFAVPVNRSASILAGVVASTILAAWLGVPMPSVHQLLGAGLVIAAIVVLSTAARR